MSFQVVDDLPAREPRAHETFAKEAIRFLIKHPDQWVEVARHPLRLPSGSSNVQAYYKARALADFGIQTEVRRDGDHRVTFARLVVGGAA